MNFQGPAKKLDDIDLPKLGYELGVGEDELHAFIDVETRGGGFDNLGRPRILFERHIFYRELPKEKRQAAVNAGLASKSPGGYGKESEQYGKLGRAMLIDKEAALRSCSWGLAQIMGFNHKLAGYATVDEMIEDFIQDEENHLAAAVRFIKAAGLDDELRGRNWAAFAKGYNGPNYRINRYDEKLTEAFAKWQRVKDTPWTPGAAPVSPAPAPKPAPKETPIYPEQPKTLPVAERSWGKELGFGLAALIAAAFAYFMS